MLLWRALAFCLCGLKRECCHIRVGRSWSFDCYARSCGLLSRRALGIEPRIGWCGTIPAVVIATTITRIARGWPLLTVILRNRHHLCDCVSRIRFNGFARHGHNFIACCHARGLLIPHQKHPA